MTQNEVRTLPETKYCEVCLQQQPAEGFERQWGDNKEIDICEVCIGKTRYQRELCNRKNFHGNMYTVTKPHKVIKGKQSRVYRNNPCPCGSGKKLKQCCLEKYRG